MSEESSPKTSVENNCREGVCGSELAKKGMRGGSAGSGDAAAA